MKKAGEMNVKRMMRSVAAGIFLACFGAAYARAANFDTIVLSVTPGGINYAVQIASPEAQGYDFSSVNFGATTVSTKAITVTNAGNAAEYFAMAVSGTSPDAWSPISSGTPGVNQFLMMGQLLTSGSPQPAPSAFNVNNDTMTVTVPNTAGGRYGQSARTNPGTSKDLWLSLTMPSGASTASQQTMTVTINGQAN